MRLSELPIGKTARVVSMGGSGALRQHLLDMGLLPGTEVTLMKRAPIGDPLEVRLRGYELTLRQSEADEITIADPTTDTTPWDVQEETQAENAGSVQKASTANPLEEISHPGYGEAGKYHVANPDAPVVLDTPIRIALIGNQNCGKTTLFNRLTGSNQHVGNFPGVTIDRKDGVIRGHQDAVVTDLPGIYSLSPFTSEEVVAREFLFREKPHVIINIVDATNIARNLYLTIQLLEIGIPMVLALNMMDEVHANGSSIRVNEMEAILGMPVVPISAAKGEGIDELVSHALHIARFAERPAVEDFCGENDHGGAVHRCLHGIMYLIADHAERAGLPLRFSASKVIEGDPYVLSALKLDENERSGIERIVSQMEAERGLDRATAMADMRFAFIEKLCAKTVVRPKMSREHIRSLMIDQVLTGRFTAIPVFLLIMALVFWLTFDVIGAWLSNLLDLGITALTGEVNALLTQLGINEVVHSLVIDAVFEGVGSVVSFVPTIVVLFFFLSILEDSGYMARVAFVTDALLRRIGLSGRSIVPLLVGFGCSVPAVMASRTMPSARDRKMTILLIPFMSCSAKLPIYAFLTAAFFPKEGGLVMVFLYLFGILTGILLSYILKKSVFKGEAVPFVMELPNYRMPSPKNVLLLLRDKAQDFIERAFTVIFVATIIIWFLSTFDFQFNQVTNPQTSMLAATASLISPLFAPLGLDDWRLTTALISGFMAKESVVSTLAVLFSEPGGISTALTTLSALTLLVFCLLYTPCVAAIAAIKRELGTRWAIWIAFFQLAIAWVLAWVVHLVASAFLA